MRAIMEETHGAPEVLRVSEHPIPEPAPGQVLIRVRAAGVNRADAPQRRTGRGAGYRGSECRRIDRSGSCRDAS